MTNLIKLPHFHLKRLEWLKNWSLATEPFKDYKRYIVCIWTECSVCGHKKDFTTVTCTENPGWVYVE